MRPEELYMTDNNFPKSCVLRYFFLIAGGFLFICVQYENHAAEAAELTHYLLSFCVCCVAC